MARSSNATSVGSSTGQTRPDAFLDASSFELAQSGQHVHLEPTGGRGGVDPFIQAREGYAEGLEFLEQQH